MSSETINAQGLSCPQPVILVKKAIDRGRFPIAVTVDSETAKENVTRMATHSGCSVNVEGQGALFLLRIDKR
jgi:tRNA 2-thiouridine synthesizing protein A